jgi:hypothetical protein
MGIVKGPPPRVSSNSGQPNEAGDDASASKSSGRVTFDSRGNSVWEWKAEETGQYSRDVSTQRLKKLEAADLSIEETARVKRPDGLSLADAPLPGGGFNPYDNGPTKHNTKMPTRGYVAPDRVAPTPERKPTKDLRALSKWMELKKRVAQNKDED